MAYFFLDDGGPEAEDYESNYFYFDENDPESFSSVIEILMKHQKIILNNKRCQSQQPPSVEVPDDC